MSALDALIDTLPRTTLVVGKGGVGKTTCAIGIAALFAKRGTRTLLLSTDPAAALATVLDAPVGGMAAPLPALPALSIRQLSANELRSAFLERWRDVIAEIVDRGTYLDRSEVDGIVDAALPGADEIFALLALADVLAESPGYERIVVDTAPTGHTLRLLALPETFSALVSMLDRMQDKHRFMVRALTHRYRRDRADDFIDEMRGRIDRLRAALVDPSSLAAVLVTRDEPIVLAESRRYLDELVALHVRVAAIVVNALARQSDNSKEYFDTTLPLYTVAARPQPPVGVDAVVEAVSTSPKRWSKTSPKQSRSVGAQRGRKRDVSIGAPAAMSTVVHDLVRVLTIVGGKGGVGKSTVACALAIAAVGADHRRTLLVSTDPAPSLADALGQGGGSWATSDTEHEVEGAPGLVVRQMDATAAFTRVRDEYQSRVDDVFSALVGRGVGMDVERDRAIIRDLLALAPPGIDELYALSILGDALVERRFDRIVVDPAPTGHLLRLLDMPALALDWSHRLMRLMLDYREVVGLGEAAQELLNFAKRTRALDALLHDAARSSLVIVSLDESVVRVETERLVSEVRSRHIDVSAVLWNRVRTPPSPLPVASTVRQLFAGELEPPPVGVDAIRRWTAAWAPLSSNSGSAD